MTYVHLKFPRYISKWYSSFMFHVPFFVENIGKEEQVSVFIWIKIPLEKPVFLSGE